MKERKRVIIHGDSMEVLKTLEDESVDAVVTDPPYGLNNTSPKHVAECLKAWSEGETWSPKGSGFMGRAWDAWVPPPELWREVLRVLKKGGHALVFAGSRTQDLMSISLRLAGFEVRDTLMWLYGNGFPKSLNVSKAIDKALGVEDQREVIGLKTKPDGTIKSAREMEQPTAHEGWRRPYMDDPEKVERSRQVTIGATEEARQWEGWGTALKPAYEPIILARKPLTGTVAANVLEHGTGALNIDACRVGEGVLRTQRGKVAGVAYHHTLSTDRVLTSGSPLGRYPSNVIIDDSVAEMIDEQGGSNQSRFFYTAKASRAEREAGLPDTGKRANTHPTVKPLELMRYLVKMITPPNGLILDPFAGSGSTICAAALEGFEGIGIEREAEFVSVARQRVEYWRSEATSQEPDQLSLFASISQE